ncbi:MAG: hypothetical protein J7M19_08695 [Planctomycetes bacterium]|nr:hypothetical protein [Planctomycetota bacterium]
MKTKVLVAALAVLVLTTCVGVVQAAGRKAQAKSTTRADLFANIDKDGSGTISRAEFQKYRKSLKRQKAKAAQRKEVLAKKAPGSGKARKPRAQGAGQPAAGKARKTWTSPRCRQRTAPPQARPGRARQNALRRVGRRRMRGGMMARPAARPAERRGRSGQSAQQARRRQAGRQGPRRQSAMAARGRGPASRRQVQMGMRGRGQAPWRKPQMGKRGGKMMERPEMHHGRRGQPAQQARRRQAGRPGPGRRPAMAARGRSGIDARQVPREGSRGVAGQSRRGQAMRPKAKAPGRAGKNAVRKSPRAPRADRPMRNKPADRPSRNSSERPRQVKKPERLASDRDVIENWRILADLGLVRDVGF